MRENLMKRNTKVGKKKKEIDDYNLPLKTGVNFRISTSRKMKKLVYFPLFLLLNTTKDPGHYI